MADDDMVVVNNGGGRASWFFAGILVAAAAVAGFLYIDGYFGSSQALETKTEKSGIEIPPE